MNENGDSLLHIACRSDNNDMLELLTSYDQIDVDIANSAGWTILHEVALKGNVASLRILHKVGANANVFDKVKFIKIFGNFRKIFLSKYQEL